MSLMGCDVDHPIDHGGWLSKTETATMSKAELNGFKLVDAASGKVVGTIKDLDDATANLLFVVSTDKGRASHPRQP